MNLLWTDRGPSYTRDEVPGAKPGQRRPLRIRLEVEHPRGSTWSLTVQFTYDSKEQIHVRLVDDDGRSVMEIPQGAAEMQVTHVPPFSGIGPEQTRYDRGYQNWLIGQGKPGDILRNLLIEVFQTSRLDWEMLKANVHELFAADLLDPSCAPADPFIGIECRDMRTESRHAFDLASAGSGFHQVLTLLGFLYARPASILLLDEPDAHQHVILQREVWDRLRTVARQRGAQLLVATHSEVLLESTIPPMSCRSWALRIGWSLIRTGSRPRQTPSSPTRSPST
jgi:hypothetical protein